MEAAAPAIVKNRGQVGGGGTAEGAGSGADGSGEGGSIVEIVDPEGLFSGIGVSSLPELEEKIQNDGLLGYDISGY